MFDDKGFYCDLQEHEGTLIIKVSNELIIHLIDKRKELRMEDLTEDLLLKLMKMLFEGSPDEQANYIRRLWREESGSRALLKLILVPPDQIRLRGSEPLRPGAELGYFIGLHPLSKRKFKGWNDIFKKKPQREIVI